jgi:Tol biopolymer transport system component
MTYRLKSLTAFASVLLTFSFHAYGQTKTNYDTGPSWSTDGKQIGFSSSRSGDFEIFAIDPQGKNIVQLTDAAGADHYPVWSPDGKKIAFCSERDGNPEIYIMNADGSKPKNITNNPARDAERPGWSPDGRKIIFQSNRDGNVEIYLMNADGSEIQRLTRDSLQHDIHPAISPDGRSVVYTVLNIQKKRSSVYVMDIAGNNKRMLAEEGSFPSWSSDGRYIVFQSQRDNKKGEMGRPTPEIYVMNSDGSNPKNVSNNEYWDYYCYFSPAGKEIVFTSNRDGNQEIYTMDIQGKNVKRLTFNE